MYEIDHIDKEDLPRLENLLRNSFGDTFDLSDEVDCFDSMPTSSWFFLADDIIGPQAFIRCFPMEENVFSGEFYAEPSEQREVYIRITTNALGKTFPNSTIQTCEIITLATANDSRRKGYGAALLNKFFSFAASQFKAVILKVEKNNLAAIRLYEMTGFQRVEEKTEQWWYVDPKNS